jgi:hypothetical protein
MIPLLSPEIEHDSQPALEGLIYTVQGGLPVVAIRDAWRYPLDVFDRQVAALLARPFRLVGGLSRKSK